jgi:hypothetical protein
LDAAARVAVGRAQCTIPVLAKAGGSSYKKYLNSW